LPRTRIIHQLKWIVLQEEFQILIDKNKNLPFGYSFKIYKIVERVESDFE
jgi:hypothetical protein